LEGNGPPRSKWEAGRWISDDGRWWWDGTQWVAVELGLGAESGPATRRRRVPGWLAMVLLVLFWPVGLVLLFLTGWSQRAKLIAAVATLALFVAGATVASITLISSSSAPSSSGPDETAITCDQAMMKPGSTVHAREAACDIKLGAQLAALTCDKEAPSGFTLSGFDLKSGKRNSAVSNQVESGSCNLRVPSGSVANMYSDLQPTNPVVIVDFGPASRQATLSIALRCTGTIGDTPCVFVHVRTDQSYECLEDRGPKGQPYKLASGSYANQQFPAPTLNIGAPNRLVVQLNGDQLDAYLNTRLVCAAKVTRQAGDAAVHFLVFAHADTSVKLTAFIVGEAG
jgi:hypothetical protein